MPPALGADTVLTASLGGMPKMNAGPFVLGPAVMIVMTVLAAWLPARRASRVEPLTALRHE